MERNHLLGAVLDSWDRHNTVLINLLRLIPPGGLEAKITPTSRSISEMFSHLNHERRISVTEEAPEFRPTLPEVEWYFEPDALRIESSLNESAKFVRDAVESRVLAGRDLELSFPNPIYLIQFLIFHESYHHGQMKSALKVAGTPISDEDAGVLIWDVWRAR